MEEWKMLKKIKYHFRNIAKMMIQEGLLPIAYRIEKMRYRGEKTKYVFADAHNTKVPFSLEAMYEYVKSQGIEPVCHFYDYTHGGALESIKHSLEFMKILARAKYVFICDTFVPVSSGKKDPETKVAQLCHYSWPFKKLGYAVDDDVPAYYGGSVFKNYDLVTASSEMYVPILQDAMRQKDGVVQALGVSRSDVFFDEQWNAKCREEFYAQFPQARDKKVLLCTYSMVKSKLVKVIVIIWNANKGITAQS